MASFLNTVFTMELAIVNTTLNLTPVNIVPAANTIAATTFWYNQAVQVGTGGVTIPLPPPVTLNNGATFVYIKNLDQSLSISVIYSPTESGSPVDATIVLPPGGVFLYYAPAAGTGVGIGAITLVGTGATVNVEVLVGI